MLYIHGAGWVFGNAKTHDRLVRELDATRLSTGLAPEEARRAVEEQTGQSDRAGDLGLRRKGAERIFAVRVTSEGAGKDAEGHVVTFDDITELVSAQRSTAWADYEDGARSLEDAVYRWVADHRSLLGRPLPGAARRWADGVISGSRPDSR